MNKKNITNCLDIISSEHYYFKVGRSKKKINKKELRYYFLKLTNLLILEQKFKFLSYKYFKHIPKEGLSFTARYFKINNRKLYPHKQIYMNKVLSHYNLINIYYCANGSLSNLYSIGSAHPLFLDKYNSKELYNIINQHNYTKLKLEAQQELILPGCLNYQI